MEYIFSRIFGDTAQRHGVVAALVAVAVFAIILIAAYAAKAKVDLWRQEAAAAGAERTAAEQARMRDSAAREAEKQALIATINSAREQNFKIVQDSLQRGEAMTKAIMDVAGEARAQVGALNALSVSLTAHREESSSRAGKIYEKIAHVGERLASIEGHIGTA